eukprot:scaffold12670_cov119-Isochrysis_galbana.AAC.7
MGDPAQYPEVRMARFLYAMQWLPPDLRADYGARQQWIDNNMSYLDGFALGLLHYHDADFRRDTWFTYHNLYMCRLGVCPNWLWDIDVYGLSTPTAIIHSCPICFNPQLPNPQIFPARSIAEGPAKNISWSNAGRCSTMIGRNAPPPAASDSLSRPWSRMCWRSFNPVSMPLKCSTCAGAGRSKPAKTCRNRSASAATPAFGILHSVAAVGTDTRKTAARAHHCRKGLSLSAFSRASLRMDSSYRRASSANRRRLLTHIRAVLVGAVEPSIL